MEKEVFSLSQRFNGSATGHGEESLHASEDAESKHLYGLPPGKVGQQPSSANMQGQSGRVIMSRGVDLRQFSQPKVGFQR